MSDKTTPLIGKILDTEQPRDAIHIAVIPCIVGYGYLRPGQKVILNNEQKAFPSDKDWVGIVDPYIQGDYIGSGQRFWLFLKPGSITSLRHSWTHPKFDEVKEAPIVDSKEFSRRWLENYAISLFSYEPSEDHGSRFDCLISYAKEGYFPTDIERYEITPEFWYHYETYTGIIVTNKPQYFSCSC